MSEEVLSEARLEEIAERVLTFQRFIYRRAWGTYYAVWAAAFVVFVFGSQLPLQSLVPGELGWVPYALLYGGVGFVAAMASFRIFKNAHRTIYLRDVTGAPTQMGGRNFAFVWVWWIGFYVLVFASFTVFQREALSILYASLFPVEIFIYYSLRLSFEDKTPLEGRLALASYGLCVLVSFLASLFTDDFLLFGTVWGITTATWVFCALYALRSAPEELVELRY